MTSLSLTFIKLGAAKLMGHTDKNSNIHLKPILELGGYYCNTSNQVYLRAGSETLGSS